MTFKFLDEIRQFSWLCKNRKHWVGLTIWAVPPHPHPTSVAFLWLRQQGRWRDEKAALLKRREDLVIHMLPPVGGSDFIFHLSRNSGRCKSDCGSCVLDSVLKYLFYERKNNFTYCVCPQLWQPTYFWWMLKDTLLCWDLPSSELYSLGGPTIITFLQRECLLSVRAPQGQLACKHELCSMTWRLCKAKP